MREPEGDMMKRLFTAACCLLLAACAMNPAQFSPGDADPKQFSRDEYECERDARSIRGDSCDQMLIFERCMRSKGYAEIKGTARRSACG